MAPIHLSSWPQLLQQLHMITNPKSGPIEHTSRLGLQQLQITTKQPVGRLSVLAVPETHLGPAGQAVGANPLKPLAPKITIITNNYKPKSGPIGHTKRFGLPQLQIITQQPFGRLSALAVLETHLGLAGQAVGANPLSQLAPVTTTKLLQTQIRPDRPHQSVSITTITNTCKASLRPNLGPGRA